MKITKEQYDALPDGMKTAFKQVEGSEDYSNGEEDAQALKNALDSEKEAKKKAAKERDDLKATQDAEKQKAVDEALEKARKGGDFEAIENDYKQKQAAMKQELDELKAKNIASIVDTAQGKVISELAGIFTAPELAEAYLNTRIKTDVGEDGVAITRVLDANGTPTAATIEDLKKEIVDNPKFKSMIVASKGSGSGATGSTKGDGSGATSQQDGKFSDASVDDKVERLTAKLEAGE